MYEYVLHSVLIPKEKTWVYRWFHLLVGPLCISFPFLKLCVFAQYNIHLLINKISKKPPEVAVYEYLGYNAQIPVGCQYDTGGTSTRYMGDNM